MKTIISLDKYEFEAKNKELIVVCSQSNDNTDEYLKSLNQLE